jgi:hypothetical protein
MIPELDLVARLRDVHPPPAPSWWPLAPGWWVALLLVVVLAVIAIRYAPPWWRRLRMRQQLMATFEAIARRHRAGAPADKTVAEISSLLRLAALARYPDRDVAGLHGSDWIAFLDACERAPGRFEAVRDALTVAPYGEPGASVDAAPLLRAARGWLRAVV